MKGRLKEDRRDDHQEEKRDDQRDGPRDSHCYSERRDLYNKTDDWRGHHTNYHSNTDIDQSTEMIATRTSSHNQISTMTQQIVTYHWASQQSWT